VARKVDWSALWLLVRRAHVGWMILGAVLTPTLMAGMTVRWRIFLAQQDIRASFGKIFSLTWAGQFFNSVLPGSTGGDVVKIYQLCRMAPDRKAAAAATVVADRLSALIALALMAAAALIIDPLPLELLARWNVRLPTVLLVAAAVTVLGAGLAWSLLHRLRATRLVGRITRTLTAVKANVGLNAASAAAFALALLLHCVNFLTLYCFSRALDVTITYWQVLLMMPVLFFLMMLPITINGHGLRELLLIGYFTQLGVTAAGHPEAAVQEIAVGVSLLGVTNEILWSVPGGLVYFFTFRGGSAAAPSGPAITAQP
jgi:glycosyltransferase 2 family protein